MANDIQQIEKLMYKYAWALDFCDWSKLETCFAEPLQFHSSTMKSYFDFSTLQHALSARTGLFNLRRHMISNAFIRLEGNKGYFYGNLINVREKPDQKMDDLFIAGGYYRNEVVKTPHGWKIAIKCWQDVWEEGRLPEEMLSGEAHRAAVMSGIPEGSTFGVSNEQDADPTSNDRQSVCDRVTRLFRHADANDKLQVEALLGSCDVEFEGATTSAEICANGADRLTYLTNTLVTIDGDQANYAAYLYQVANTAGEEENDDSGGCLAVALTEREAGKWQIRSLRYEKLWTKGEDLNEDPRRGLSLSKKFLVPFQNAQPCGSDEEQVAQLHAKYTWCFDVGDFGLMESCFSEDVACDFQSGMGKRFDRRSMIEQLAIDRDLKPLYQHYVFNPLVTVNGDTANYDCYAFTRRTPDGGGEVLCAGGRYSAIAVRQGSGWVFSQFNYQRDYGPYR